jgi:hypothetical protein
MSLIFGTLSFLNPFRKGFSHKEALVYCSRRQGPTGLWERECKNVSVNWKSATSLKEPPLG